MGSRYIGKSASSLDEIADFELHGDHKRHMSHILFELSEGVVQIIQLLRERSGHIAFVTIPKHLIHDLVKQLSHNLLVRAVLPSGRRE